MLNRLYIENVLIALRSIRGQALRTTLTVLIIAVGITALVGILTAIDALQGKIEADFSRMGSNTFNILPDASIVRGNRRGERRANIRSITYRQAQAFMDRYDYNATVSLASMVSNTATVRHESEKSNPNVQVLAVTTNYVQTAGYEIESGRSFNAQEGLTGAPVALIGKDVEEVLFGKNNLESTVGKTIGVGSNRFTIIGVLASKGNSIGFSGDNQVLIPLRTGRLNLLGSNSNYVINVQTPRAEELEAAELAATGLMRNIRGDRAGMESSFGIRRSDSLATTVITQLSLITVIATIIGAITLLGAAIGLMNMMLVSVTERTREIGVRKAIGASGSTIRAQFLVEAIVISQLGGILGIVLGIGIGNIVSFFIGSSFIIPWKWIIGGTILCFIVGVVSGYYPAKKAAALDPIDALRYE